MDHDVLISTTTFTFVKLPVGHCRPPEGTGWAFDERPVRARGPQREVARGRDVRLLPASDSVATVGHDDAEISEVVADDAVTNTPDPTGSGSTDPFQFDRPESTTVPVADERELCRPGCSMEVRLCLP
ncbi:hypothetical protein [Haloarchaeobius sp. HRN-SO-5]|uniref:hypothetical protein n=1 Tax=Haloarchaeobius sp. HRN-SO-5 TaxID=3446118 RepID=UPI003EBC089F